LQRHVASFENDVLRAADFVVVTRAGVVVTEETVRLTAALRRRALNVAAEVYVGAPEAMSEFAIPLSANARGCDGLRAWGTSAPTIRAHEPFAADLADALPWLRTLPDLLLFVGK